MKNKGLTIFLIILLSIIAIVLLGIFIVLLNVEKLKLFSIGNYNESTNIVYDREYDDIFNQINIDVNSANIEIKENKENKVKLIMYSEKNEEYSVNSNSNDLNININNDSCKFLCFNFKTSKVILSVPNNNNKMIKIKDNFGNIKVEGLLNNIEFDIDSNAGNVKLDSIKSAIINNDYGDIFVSSANDLNLNASAGNIKVDNVGKITAKNDYGNIDIDKIEGSANIKENCGNIKINSLYLIEDSIIENDLGNIKIGNTNEVYIDANTELGNTNIKNNYRNSNINLKIKNDCGNIEVNN
ncbi:MAG: hypothetical protein IJ572_02385 [Bacilli bacterium]|nr:hypothetical protein [Bacilli bacterium]